MQFYPRTFDEAQKISERYFQIVPVTVVTRGRHGGETFTNSIWLFVRLEAIARRGIAVTRMEISGKPLATHSLRVLNTYFRIHGTLRSYDRISPIPSRHTKYHWEDFAKFLSLTTDEG